MPISFSNDSSTQQGGTFTSGSTFYSNVNSLTLLNTSNALKTFIDNKQDTLTASTSLIGNGGSITAINWNNVTTNKPTNFQADWNTTIINKPSTFPPDLTNVYTKTEVNNITTLTNFYNKTTADGLYQPILTFNSPMTKTGNIVTIDLSSYATITSLTSNSNILEGKINTKENILTFSSPLTRTTNNISIDLSSYLTTASAASTYATITNLNAKENTLTFSSPLTRTTNTIGINLSGYATTANLASYLPLAGGQMTGNIGFGIAPSSTILINCSNASSTAFQNIQMMNNIGEFFYFGIAGNAAANSNYLNNFFIQASKGLVFNSMNKTHTGIPDMIINNTSVGINTTAPNTTYKLDVNGNINGLILYEGGVTLASKYLQSATLANYVLKAGDTMTGALTVNGNINITGSATNSLIFDNAYNLKKIQLNSTNGFGSDGSSITIYSSGGFAFRNSTLTTTLYSVDSAGSMSTNGTIYPNGGLNTIGTVTANSVVANSFTEGGVLLSNKYITSASLDTTYLRLNGANDMSGKLTVLNGNGLTTPQLGEYGGAGDRIILWKGGGNYPYSLGMNGGTMWYSVPNGAIHNFYVNGVSECQINSAGLTVFGNVSTQTLAVVDATSYTSQFQLLISTPTSTTPARIQTIQQGIGYSQNLILQGENLSGNVGIGTLTNITSKLTVNGDITGAKLSLYSTTQLEPRLILSGQEFYVPFNGTLQNSSTEGIAFLSGVNRAGNRQLWIGDSANLTQNATNSVLRLTNLGYIDCIGTDGLTRKQLTIGNLYLGANGVNIGMNTTSYKSTRTILTIAGGSFGYSEPLVQITQTNGWDGNYALQVKGYANFGSDTGATGLRINGEDTGNTIFQNGNNPIGFTVNNSWMAFNTNGGERMRIAANGELFFVNNAWQRSYDNVYRMYYETNGRTYFSSGGNLGFTFRSTDQLVDAVRIENNGNIRSARSVYCEGQYGYFLNINANNYWTIYTGTTNGVANSLTFFHGASGLASYWYLNGTQNGTMSEISDKRSKKNIQDFSALETIEKLKPKTFDVIDDKDIRHQYGFIAQDIEEIPELKKLVFTEPNYIANVNAYATLKNDDGSCIITANDDLTDKIAVGDELKFVSDNNDKENQEFVLDATPYHNRYKRRYAKVTEIISPTEFKVDCEINKFCNDQFLIYGKKVEDAKSLDYNSFIALNTKAIQELYKIIREQQEQINLLLSYRNVIN
jgi:hypothetical protein